MSQERLSKMTCQVYFIFVICLRTEQIVRYLYNALTLVYSSQFNREVIEQFGCSIELMIKHFIR